MASNRVALAVAEDERRQPHETANPCSQCGTSNWDCLYEINCGRGRCCWKCGLVDVHSVLAPKAEVSG